MQEDQQPTTPAEEESSEALKQAHSVLDWFQAWNDAWEACEEHGLCDAIYGMEYRRIMVQAYQAKLPPSQAAMRAFIRRLANWTPPISVTEASLRAREARRNQNTKED